MHLVLRIRDDGADPPDVNQQSRLGLRMMQYRADLIGTLLTMTTSDEGGGLVECTMPLHVARYDSRH